MSAGIKSTTLNETQRAGLRILAVDPERWVEAGTLGKLRRLGLVVKRIETTWTDGRPTTKTTSPLTPEGRAMLAKIGGAS